MDVVAWLFATKAPIAADEFRRICRRFHAPTDVFLAEGLVRASGPAYALTDKGSVAGSQWVFIAKQPWDVNYWPKPEIELLLGDRWDWDEAPSGKSGSLTNTAFAGPSGRRSCSRCGRRWLRGETGLSSPRPRDSGRPRPETRRPVRACARRPQSCCGADQAALRDGVGSTRPAARRSESVEWLADLNRVPMRRRRTQPRASRPREPSTALAKLSVSAAADDRFAQLDVASSDLRSRWRTNRSWAGAVARRPGLARSFNSERGRRPHRPSGVGRAPAAICGSDRPPASPGGSERRAMAGNRGCPSSVAQVSGSTIATLAPPSE
jgi:hypothetical protein